MSLKSLIQWLLDSRTTPAQAANASKPVSGIPVEYNPSPSIGIWGQVLPDSIAVSDGYIWAAGRTSAIGGFLQVNSQAMQITTSGTSIGEGEMLNIFIPVSKGQGFTVYARSMNQIVVRLVRTIGGGYNYFVRRALSCLRPSFNYLPRSFCKAKNLGFQNNQLLLSIRALIFLAQAPRTSLAMLHRATAGRLLGAIQAQSQLLKFKSIMGKWHLLPSSTETPLGVVSAVTSKKEPLLNSYAEAETHRIIPFGSTKQVQTLNLLSTGGALC